MINVVLLGVLICPVVFDTSAKRTVKRWSLISEPKRLDHSLMMSAWFDVTVVVPTNRIRFLTYRRLGMIGGVAYIIALNPAGTEAASKVSNISEDPTDALPEIRVMAGIATGVGGNDIPALPELAKLALSFTYNACPERICVLPKISVTGKLGAAAIQASLCTWVRARHAEDALPNTALLDCWCTVCGFTGVTFVLA